MGFMTGVFFFFFTPQIIFREQLYFKAKKRKFVCQASLCPVIPANRRPCSTIASTTGTE